MKKIFATLLLVALCFSFAGCTYVPIKVQQESLITDFRCNTGVAFCPYVELELKNITAIYYDVHIEVEIYYYGTLDVRHQQDITLDGLKNVTLSFRALSATRMMQHKEWSYKITKLDATEIEET